MKNIILVVLFFMIGSAATAQKKTAARQPGEIESVQIFRTGCHGKCPIYSVEIDKNGNVTYIAVRFCADSGTFLKNIGAAKASEIMKEVALYRPDTCKDVYVNRVPDQSGLIYTIKYKNKIKNIRNAKFGPAFLAVLSRDIEAAGKKTDNAGWKKVMPPKKR